jgi:hypothetical protein
MGWVRRNKGDAVASAAIAIGLLAVVLAFLVGPSDDGPRAGSVPDAPFGAPVVDPTPGTYEGPDAGATPSSPVGQQVAAARDGVAPGDGTGLGLPSGLQGSGGTKGLPEQRITLAMRSTAPIGTIGYVVPTSLDHSHGVVEDVGTSWSLTTTGYGAPDHAQLFAQSGPTGAPITCTVTVNGTVTESRSTSGPYSQLFCQG